MDCRLPGASPLVESVFSYCLIDPWGENFSEIWIKMHKCHVKKMHLKSKVDVMNMTPRMEQLADDGDVMSWKRLPH